MKERTSRGAPCIFCGDVGYDMRVIYPETEDVVHWCHKTKVSKGDIVTVGGKDYICISDCHSTKEASMGSFQLFKEYLTKEEWIEKQKRNNPGWSCNSSIPMRPMNAVRREKTFIPATEGELLPGEVETLSNRELDERYRFLLSQLILEDKHKEAFHKEWQSPLHDVMWLLDTFKVVSLPPPDKGRFKSSYPYKNPSRKQLVKKLFQRFGSLSGIPGMYERTGSYWEARPEWERWTFSFPSEGIIYPCYDKDGNLYRIRIKDDYPDLVVKEGKFEPFNGAYGYFHTEFDKEGVMKTFFVSDEGSKTEVSVSSRYGKARGKYKNFSSVYERIVDGKVVNALKNGCKSGSPLSLYSEESDNFSVVILTEGEKKAMVAHGIKKIPCVSIPGVTNWPLFFKDEKGSMFDKLRERGAKCFIVCYDADKDENSMVADSEKALLNAIREHGAIPMIGSWKHDFDKGLDDILLLGLDISVSRA